MTTYYDDVPEEADIRWVSSQQAPTGTGSVQSHWGQDSPSVPIGLHITPQQRCEARLRSRGFEIVRQQRGPHR